MNKCLIPFLLDILSEFDFPNRKFKMDIEDNKKALRKLKVTAEQCKCALSNMNNSMCSVDSLHDGIDFSCQVTRLSWLFYCCFRKLSAVIENSGVSQSSVF